MKSNDLDEFDSYLVGLTEATRRVASKVGIDDYQPTLFLFTHQGEATVAALSLDDITFTEAVDAYIDSEYRKIAASRYLFLAKSSKLEGKPIIFITGYCANGRDNAAVLHFDDEGTSEYYYHDNPGAEETARYARIAYQCALNLVAEND